MSEYHNFRFAIFDVEGTLLDNKKLHRRAVEILSQISNRFWFLRKHRGFVYLATSGTLFSYSCRRLKPLLGYCPLFVSAADRLDRLSFEFFDAFDNGKGLALFPGAKKVLEEMFSNGVEMLASTGAKTQKTKERLDSAGVLKYFTLVLGGDILPKSEHIPHFAEHFDLGLEKFALNSVYFGDTPYDMGLAKIYGAYGVGITITVDAKTLIEAGAKDVVDGWEELLEQKAHTKT